MILGLIKPSGGSIRLFGESMEVERKRILSRIGALIEKPLFYKYLSARRNLKILATLSGMTHPNDIDRVLGIVKLSERADDKVKTFSHGMQQRLGIAQALLNNPEFIILDEPTSGLDPQGMKEIRELTTLHSRKSMIISSRFMRKLKWKMFKFQRWK